MSLIEKLLEPINVKFEELNPGEQETLNSMIDTLQKSQLSVSKIRESIGRMKAAVERDISKQPTFVRVFIFKVENPNIIRLQARLRNYLLLEAFLSTPEKAQAELDRAVGNLKPATKA